MKIKIKKEKHEQQQESEPQKENQISKVLNKKQIGAGNIYYFVQYKNSNEKTNEWKHLNELVNLPGFKKLLKKFETQSKKNKQQSQQKPKAVHVPTEKKVDSNFLKQLTSNKEAIEEKLKKVGIPQQISLEKFVGKSPKKQQEVKLQKTQKTPKITESKKNIEVKKELVSQTVKIPQIFEKKKIEIKSQGKTVDAEKKVKQPQKIDIAAFNGWVEKIKAIKSVKGYELRGDQLVYEVDAWNGNGQTLFVPPLPSEIVRKFDEKKLASFLQDSLIRGYQRKEEV